MDKISVVVPVYNVKKYLEKSFANELIDYMTIDKFACKIAKTDSLAPLVICNGKSLSGTNLVSRVLTIFGNLIKNKKTPSLGISTT